MNSFSLGLGIGLSKGVVSGGVVPSIVLFDNAVDDSAASGTDIGSLSVINTTGGPWTYTLIDGASGQFTLSSSTVKAGSGLSHTTAPTPSIVVRATDGVRTATSTIQMDVRKALPALPLATGAKVVGLGHHAIQIGQAINQSGNRGTSNVYHSVLNWAWSLDPRFNYDNFFQSSEPYGRTAGSILTMTAGEGFQGGNQGVEADILCAAPIGPASVNPATNTPGVLSRVAFTLARGPGIIYVHIGENDIAGGRTSAAIIADINTLLKRIPSEGVPAILSTLTPSWPSWSAEQATIRDEVNTWIKAQPGRIGVYIADMTTAWPDTGSLLARTINQIGAPWYDALAPDAGYRGAKVLNAVLATLVASGSTFNQDPTVGNIMPNPGMTGTGGSKGTGVSGNIADGYTVSRLAGSSTMVGSKEVVSAGLVEKQVFAIAPITDALATRVNRFRFGRSATTMFSANGLTTGQWVRNGGSWSFRHGTDGSTSFRRSTCRALVASSTRPAVRL